MPPHTTDKDLGWKKLLQQVKDMGDAYVDVGLFDAPKHPGKTGEKQSELSVAEVGIVHEYGYPPLNIPERSFLRAGERENSTKFNRFLSRQYDKILAAQTNVVSALAAFGEYAAGKIRLKITKGPFEALEPTTIARKGSSKPLINTGVMKNWVAARVVVGGSKKTVGRKS